MPWTEQPPVCPIAQEGEEEMEICLESPVSAMPSRVGPKKSTTHLGISHLKTKNAFRISSELGGPSNEI